jgi:hypothetical protein
MTKNTAIHWTTTGLVCAVLVLSAINFNLKEPLGPMKVRSRIWDSTTISESNGQVVSSSLFVNCCFAPLR